MNTPALIATQYNLKANRADPELLRKLREEVTPMDRIDLWDDVIEALATSTEREEDLEEYEQFGSLDEYKEAEEEHEKQTSAFIEVVGSIGRIKERLEDLIERNTFSDKDPKYVEDISNGVSLQEMHELMGMVETAEEEIPSDFK